MKAIKEYISSNIGNEFFITVDGDKKSKKIMRCVIKEVYASLFLVDVLDGSCDCQKTFTYSEVHCKEIDIVKVQ